MLLLPPLGCLLCFGLMLVLSGCGRSARQAAERERQAAELERHVAQEENQAARQKLRECLAAVRVCTKGATYTEFRKQRLAVETCYGANKGHLSAFDQDFRRLSALMEASDICWQREIRFPTLAMNPSTATQYAQDQLNAMQVIYPSITNKLGLDFNQREKDPMFYARNYVHIGLRKIDDQCELMLVTLDEFDRRKL